jgi:Tol biopolymer transport system component
MLIPGASNATYAPPGVVIYGRREMLLAQRIDLRKLSPVGEPFVIAQGVARHVDDNFSLFSTSLNDVLTYRSPLPSTAQLAWYRRDGARLGPVGVPGNYYDMNISPDETQLMMVHADSETEGMQIWTLDLSNGIFTRVTSQGVNLSPVWSSDGREVLFGSLRGAPELDLYRKEVSARDEQLLFQSRMDKLPKQCLRDGSVLFLGEQSPGPGDFYLLPARGPAKPALLLKSESADVSSPRVSPDGKWIAYQSNESGGWEILLATFPGFAKKRQISNGGGCQPLWRKDGAELFYLGRDGKLMAIDVQYKPRIETSVPKVLFQTPVHVSPLSAQYCVTANGRKFLLSEPVEASSHEQISVVLNWPGLKR